ncbi:MAG: hypothetical protein M3P18_01240 [Actinomycetota bacterium]|nr:hypothetical protein [Actinomycetota bacterium]
MSIEGSTRLVTKSDLLAIASHARSAFDAFHPLYVSMWSCEPPGTWAHTRADNRNVAGRLGDLRRLDVPPMLSATAASNLDFYDRYVRSHEEHVDREPTHAFHTRIETREDLSALLEARSLFEVWVDRVWAGVLAAEPGVQRGLRGAVVVERFLDPSVRDNGYGRYLSTLLARNLSLPVASAVRVWS